MKQLVIISGKGGTGKTSIVASLANIAGEAARVVTADCDVDAANLALLMPGEDIRIEKFWSGRRAVVDNKRCTACAQCVDLCRSEAITMDEYAVVDTLACEGCGVCAIVCPEQAIDYKDNHVGYFMERETKVGPLLHAELGIAQDNSGKLVAKVREEARKSAQRENINYILIDGPPGIGCPVHASITGCDLALLVVEPSPSSEHDMMRALDLLEKFQIPAALLVNKCDLSSTYTDRIQAFSKESGIPVVGKVPFFSEVPLALSRGRLPLEIQSIAAHLSHTWKQLASLLEREKASPLQPSSG